MKERISVKDHIEQNGLIIIAVAMALIYWWFDSMVTDQVLIRLLVVCLIFIYGIFTQYLINYRKMAEVELKKAHDELERRVKQRTAELILANEDLKREVRERKLAEEEKRKLEDQLLHAQKMEALGTLAGGIAHDFNNLLQAISGYTQLLLMKKDSSDADYAKLEVIQGTTQRASELTRQLLIFGRKVESKLKPLDLNHEVQQVSSILERTIPRMITIKTKLSENLNVISGDAGQLEQILMNLGVNARDAMPEGGILSFQTENVTLAKGYYTALLGALPGDYVQLTVSDTGVGMDKETIKHIFEPFYTTKEAGKGTGLGLAIVYGIVKSHGGFVRCTSEPGGGTTFKIYFPIFHAKGVDAASEARRDAEAPRGHETIMLVDDEKTILDIGRELLTQYGYQVITAEGGEKAVELYTRSRDGIDLIILDLIMPGMGGTKCYKELQKTNPDVKIIVSSGAASEEQVREAFEMPPAAFISKPYQFRDMLSKVRDVLDRK